MVYNDYYELLGYPNEGNKVITHNNETIVIDEFMTIWVINYVDKVTVTELQGNGGYVVTEIGTP